MRCPSCHSENAADTRFCIECGGAFEHRCAKCGFDNLPQAKFCGRCGSSFTEPTSAQTSRGSTPNVGTSDDAPTRRSGHDGERRRFTGCYRHPCMEKMTKGQLEQFAKWQERLDKIGSDVGNLYMLSRWPWRDSRVVAFGGEPARASSMMTCVSRRENNW